MKTAQAFGHAVNNAGLPRNWCTILASGNENIKGLSAQEIAKTYWLLESIGIEYAYVINGVRKVRKVVLSTDVEPLERIATAPVFYHNNTDDDGIECTIELEINSIAHSEDDNGAFSMNLIINERDENSLFMLSCEDIDGENGSGNGQGLSAQAQRAFKFLNRELEIKLWTVDNKWLGEIEYFRISPEYYVIETRTL